MRALRTNDSSHIRLAQPRGRFDKCIEHCLQIEGRAADNLEDVGGGSLLLQRFAQIFRPLAQFLEKTCVLNGDNGLSGEVGDQLNLLVRKRPHFFTVDVDGAD